VSYVYSVGETVRQTFCGVTRVVKITRRREVNGLPGFDGMWGCQSVFGYDHQVRELTPLEQLAQCENRD